jgi:hypothetical protein
VGGVRAPARDSRARRRVRGCGIRAHHAIGAQELKKEKKRKKKRKERKKEKEKEKKKKRKRKKEKEKEKRKLKKEKTRNGKRATRAYGAEFLAEG